MVDADRLRRVLQRVADDVAVLKEYESRDSHGFGRAEIGDVKYTFVTAIEGCIDAAQHICASEGWGPPSTNADAMRVLHRHHVLDADAAESLARAVGFRNRLVHGYADVDNALVLSFLKRLGDLDAFVAAAAQLI